ncbi:hypothetical protein D3C83_302890 [compost metagenome]
MLVLTTPKPKKGDFEAGLKALRERPEAKGFTVRSLTRLEEYPPEFFIGLLRVGR